MKLVLNRLLRKENENINRELQKEKEINIKVVQHVFVAVSLLPVQILMALI